MVFVDSNDDDIFFCRYLFATIYTYSYINDDKKNKKKMKEKRTHAKTHRSVDETAKKQTNTGILNEKLWLLFAFKFFFLSLSIFVVLLLFFWLPRFGRIAEDFGSLTFFFLSINVYKQRL